MIRRHEENDWLLIQQTSHALIAGNLADAWGNTPETPKLPMSQLLLPAIRSHDAGWEEWDRNPGLNMKTGIPRSFMEMEMSTAVGIWEESIKLCCGIRPDETEALNRQFHRFLSRSGRRLTQQRSFIVDIIFSLEQPFDLELLTQRLAAHAEGQKLNRSTLLRVLELLEAADMLKVQKRAHGATLYEPPGRVRIRQPFAGVWVSRHFCHLAEQAQSSHRTSAEQNALKSFLSRQTEFRSELHHLIHHYFQSTLTQLDNTGLKDWEETGLEWMQFFDRLSLWLCCQTETETLTLNSPTGVEFHFTPLSSGEIAVAPFPFSSDSLTVTCEARRVPEMRYTHDTEFQQAHAEASVESCVWNLVKW